LFHKDCIHAWLKVDAVCPICKTNLLPQPQQPKAPDCHCSERRPAAAAPVSTAAPPAGSEAATQSAQPSAAAAQASPRAVPVSPRVRLPVFHPHALSSPMMGVAGLSP
jgi:biotin carboxyl carrier protein